MTKKHKKKQLAIKEQEGVKSSFFDKKAFLLVFCILGALIVGAIIGMLFPFNYPIQPGQAQGEGQETAECKPLEQSTEQQLSLDELKAKVKAFLDESFFKRQGGEAKITNIEKFNDYLYTVSFDFVKEDGTKMEYIAYASKDGNDLINGQIFNLNEPLKFEEPEIPEIPKSDKPNVKMFVMSYCPFGQQAEKGLKPVVELLGEKIDFEPHFVIYSNYASGYPDYCIDEEAKYCSMHGINELNENIRQLCIWKYNKELFWDYVSKINENCSLQEIETCWKGSAEAVGVDIDKIEQCFENEALELLATETELNEQYNVRGSPTILINDERYQGGRSPEAYKQGICSAFTEEPEECKQELSATSGPASGQC